MKQEPIRGGRRNGHLRSTSNTHTDTRAAVCDQQGAVHLLPHPAETGRKRTSGFFGETFLKKGKDQKSKLRQQRSPQSPNSSISKTNSSAIQRVNMQQLHRKSCRRKNRRAVTSSCLWSVLSSTTWGRRQQGQVIVDTWFFFFLVSLVRPTQRHNRTDVDQ